MVDLNYQDTVLSKIPEPLRADLLATYNKIVNNYRERRWEPAELNGGKLCEVVHSILKGAIDGKFPKKSKKPKNFLQACRDLETVGGHVCRSVRIQIPRLLIAIYEVRNNRNVGHIGGDVDPNEMDATFVLQSAKWIMAELVRVFHQIDPKDAANLVKALTERTIPLVWETGENKRVLNPDLPYPIQTLILLESCGSAVGSADLLRWTEYKNSTRFRKLVLHRLHKDRLIEFNPKTDTVALSPLGAQYVEKNVVLSS